MTAPQRQLDGVAPQIETVLVLEHDDAWRARAVGMLQNLGYRVLACADGEAAWGILQNGAGVDVIFAEVVTPGPLGALALSERAFAVNEDIEILFTSACSDAFMLDGGYLRQSVNLLRKPYEAQELDARIRHLLGNRQQRRLLHRYLQVPPATGGAASTTAPDVNALRILLVEDSEDTLHATADLLEMLGYAVSPVSSAEAALALLSDNRFDVLCSDVALPGISGVELGRRVRNAYPSMGIIFASGYGARVGVAGEGLDAIILPKPYGLEALENALRQVAASRPAT